MLFGYKQLVYDVAIPTVVSFFRAEYDSNIVLSLGNSDSLKSGMFPYFSYYPLPCTFSFIRRWARLVALKPRPQPLALFPWVLIS